MESQDSNEAPMAEEPQPTKKLPLAKVLELLIPKVETGRPIPSLLADTPPWQLPSKVLPNAEKINTILSKSMEIQSSKITGSDDFDSFIISNSCLAVSGLLRYYFVNSGLLQAKEVTLTFGVLLWDDQAREGPDDYDGTPQVWLDVKGCPIDNTHVSLPLESEELIEYFYKAKKSNQYVKEDPLKSRHKLYLGSPEAMETTKHNLKVYRTFISEDLKNGEGVEKYLVFALECIGLNPSVKMYDLLMRKYLKDEHGFQVDDLVDKWSSRCWSCSLNKSEEKELKKCTECKMAKYCGKECQKSDWKAHKLLHKELELTEKILNSHQDQEED